MPRTVDDDVLRALVASSTATLGHLTDFGFVRGLSPVGPVHTFAGPALTVRIPHADSTAVHHALSLVRPGDVIVIDQSGDDDRSSFGGTLAAIASDAGAVAAVATGRTNDVHEIRALGFPVFSRGATPLTTRILGLEGQINVPVAVGGVVVTPGDVIFGDGDGVCVLPRADAARLSAMVARLDADPVVQSLRDTVAQGTPLGTITGAAGYFEEATA
ncbi:RraA family protein [Microbacterium sp.]|jgi:regulator of RNase E activity RraA|uniref:RraA family protein n=1 Tax=Microbacterium sp. TaxID=51671 RepID=UPI002624C476|nr:RraA family protein [Microbacterium sp.]